MQRTQSDIAKDLPGLRVPPQSEDAEMALLGSIMLRPEAMYEVVDDVAPNIFYFDKHRKIFETIIELFSKNSPIDMLSVSNRLTEKNEIDAVGGSAYLAELANYVPSSANIKYYADVVVKKYTMRTLIEASEYISHLGYDESNDLETILDRAEKKIFEITNSSVSYKYVELKEALGEAYERFEHLHSSTGDLRGVQTGFASIDNKLSGLQKSDLIILAARPSMGKTSLALDIARQSATKHGVQVCIFSLEMSSQQLTDRMLASEAFVDSWKLRTGNLKDENDFNRVRDALGTLSDAPIYIDDAPGSNILKMRSVARRIKSEKGLGLIIVDYLQLMSPTNARASDSPVQQVSEISRSLKHLARELDVPVLALSQLSRDVEKRGGKPRLSDLRDSGSIEQDADVVMFIHQEKSGDGDNDSHKPRQAHIMIEKHRNGPTGQADLLFDMQKARFINPDTSNFGGAEEEFDDF